MSDRQVAREPRDDALAALLGPWLPHRRWFPAKGTSARVSAVGGTTLVDPHGEAEVRVLLLRVESGSGESVLQVPLTLRPGAVPGAVPDVAPPGGTDPDPGVAGSASGTGAPASSTGAPASAPPDSPAPRGSLADPAALVGTLPDGTLVRDGAGDPAFLRAWLACAEVDPGSPVRPEDLGDPRVISGEQSNTSVILPGAGPDGRTAMLKVFRGLSAGENPDVDVPRALARVGWEHVPRPLAWMSARWPDGQGVVHGHLEVLSAFVPGAQDGFELACAMACRGESFDELARELGEVIAQMHAALAEALPVTDEDIADGPGPDGGRAGGPAPAGSEAAGAEVAGSEGAEPQGAGTDAAEQAGCPAAHALADALIARFAWASGIVPELRDHHGRVHALAERVRLLTGLPARQRVHGDLHLGQVLRGDGTWYVLDFEGEPLRPVAERTRPDQPLRDAAGMLRSFDYAAAVGKAPDAWTRVARDAFWSGYTAAAPALDPGLASVLLRTLELDKALYEAVYEARNRPDWLVIPLHGVERLLD
ncbi:maltokinase N-terminal cap-like domain-containing protein [Cellulomonas denverensis]|uniref:maltokinase N-terminal cap-like domain-containing protein n=1 Tax=Cellulomonas denverensis TaxID=264297 RepID=UPI0035EC8267